MDPDVDMKNSPDATTEAPTNDATAEQTDQTPQVDVSSSPPPASSTPEQQQPTEAAATTDATPSETTNATSSETPETHPPKNDSPAQSQPQYVNSPSSWQIPPNVFHQSKQQQQQQQQQTMTYDPHHHMLDKAKRRREQLEQRIQENDEDLDAWYSLMGDVQQSGDLEATRAVYERFLNLYPTSAKHWLAYLELELKYSNFAEVEALFTRCLKTVLSVDLWKFYLGYIRRINAGDGGATTPESRGVIEKAYEYVLGNVGTDKDAGPIWADYIFFLKSAETTNTWEEQRKMDSMRRVYQKSVAIPLNNVEHLWKEYDQWENNLNRLTAKKFLGERSSAYMTARTALRESRPFTDHLVTNVIPRKPRWTPEEVEQLNLWKRYIRWEMGNPLHLEEKSAVVERVSYVYQQAFMALRFYPELWYDYAMYYLELSKPDKTLALLKQGMEILPTSLLLQFAFAEICESRQMLDEARSSFDALLEHLDKDIEKLRASVQQEIENIQQHAEQERANMNLGDDVDGELREQLRTRERQVKKEQDKLEDKLKADVEAIMRQCSLVWIAYMRFARRTDGIKAARTLFSKARKSPNRTYHVFVASALMEYHNSKDAGIAGKIFGLGIKSFADDPAYICEYLDFLIQMNDDNNTRALFERSLATLSAEKATAVWKKFMDYENKYGDLASAQHVEKRLHGAHPESTQLDTFLARYSYLDLRPAGELQHTEDTSDSTTTAPSQPEADSERQPEEVDQKQQYWDSQRSGRNNEPKRRLLEPVHPERYSRPDWSQWQPFKPSTGDPARMNMPAEELKRPAMNAASPPPPFVAPVPPSGPPQQVAQPNAPSQPHPFVDNGPLANLPDLIAHFVASLPHANVYTGPILNAVEVVEIFRNVNLPPLGTVPHMSEPPLSMGRGPPPPPPPPPGMKGNVGPRDMSPNRGRGRGSGMKRGAGGSTRGRGMKRKGGRDDYEDDYQSHNKGMGPNRPPDYDVFRARQAKRHRDDRPF